MEKAKPIILLVDDEPAIVHSLIRALEEEYQCLGANSAENARPYFKNHRIVCVLSDQRMPGESGSEFLAWVRKNHPETLRILITGYADFDSIVAAVNEGQIFQFLPKPWEPMHLELVIRQAVQVYDLKELNQRLQNELQTRNQLLEHENIRLKADTVLDNSAFSSLIGLSAPMSNLKKKLQALLPSQSTVLITGESGTGKELVARALHYGGPRKEKPFVAQNCAALPDSILESELFGHLKGSFTHATETRIGIIESAQGGTLFLDEVGDMTLSMQAKVLRFLQEGIITPVGSRIEKRVDLRLIAATHRDLESMVKEKSFREDLFYRLAVIPIQTPSLKSRSEDIPLLVENFLIKKAAKLGIKVPKFHPSTLAILQNYSFPGNVRELENAVEYALNMLGESKIIFPENLPEKFHRFANSNPLVSIEPSESTHSINSNISNNSVDLNSGNALSIPKSLLLDEAIEQIELDWIQRAMTKADGNISHAAKALGLSRQGLHNKLAKYGIKGE